VALAVPFSEAAQEKPWKRQVLIWLLRLNYLLTDMKEQGKDFTLARKHEIAWHCSLVFFYDLWI